MSLRPLHFLRVRPRDGSDRFVPMYGRGTYATHCGRFRLDRRGDRWSVAPLRMTSLSNLTEWLELRDHGLDRARFQTRREALEALESCFDADGLLEARLP